MINIVRHSVIFQLCSMCLSKCSGSCMTLLKHQLINSGASLIELNNLLNKITVCAIPAGIDKNIFMTELSYLKNEAKNLLDEVNQYTMRRPNGDEIFVSYRHSDIFRKSSFKMRLVILKKKIHALSIQGIELK